MKRPRAPDSPSVAKKKALKKPVPADAPASPAPAPPAAPPPPKRGSGTAAAAAPLVNVEAETGSKPANLAPAPDGPPQNTELLGTATGVSVDESYSRDEVALNNFLKLHPMLSSEACSVKTLQMAAGLFERSSVHAGELPVVGKSHDDAFLRPANVAIGERPCINADRCLANFMAQLRHGPGSDVGFTCTEFLLPSQQKTFLDGKGLPTRRGKCLLCLRYFSSYVYTLARSDPNFSVGKTALGLQVFCNPVATESSRVEYDEAQLAEVAAELPISSSIVRSRDGYKPQAMLFVDEDFAGLRAGRETKLTNMLWKPQVRFCSTHYRYVKDDDGPRIVQVGIGADDHSDGLALFRPPAPGTARPEPAE